MSKNKLGNLNDALLLTIQNLLDPEVNEKEEVVNEMTVERASAIAKVGQVMVNNAKVQIDAFKLVEKGVARASELPDILSGENHLKIASNDN